MAMNDIDDDFLSVRDLGLAAALVSLDVQVVGTRSDDDGRVYFLFLKSGDCLEAVENYWSNTLLVKARYYSDALKALKTRIYYQRGSG